MERDPLVDEETARAAEEAGGIGGRAGTEGFPPEERAVREAGGGEAEVVEQAEDLLVQHATHGDDREDSVAIHDAGRPEPEADRVTAEDAEADALPSTAAEDAAEQGGEARPD